MVAKEYTHEKKETTTNELQRIKEIFNTQIGSCVFMQIYAYITAVLLQRNVCKVDTHINHLFVND